MKVIFTDKVQGVAARGDIKNVKPGFYRNYLQPYKKAVAATDALLQQWEQQRKRMMIEKEQLRAKLEETKRRLEGITVKIEKKVTKKGTLYGGVKAADIAHAITQQLKLEIPVEAVVLGQHVKAVGAYEVELNFGDNVKSSVKIEIVEKK